MANIIKELVRRSLFPKSSNLVSFRDPFPVMQQLLADQHVTNILDAGASHGRISNTLLRMFPGAKVHAFEPNSIYTETLLSKQKDNPRLVPNFMVLSDNNGETELQFAKSPGITSIFKPSRQMRKMFPEKSETIKIESIKTVTIDSWAEEQGGIPVQLMKFDIQGGELKALQGAQNTIRNTTLLIYTEILFNPLYQGGAVYSEIDLLLRENGFILYDIYKPRYGRNGTLMWANAIFINEDKLGMDF